MGKEEKDVSLWKKIFCFILSLIAFIVWALPREYPYTVLSFYVLVVFLAIYGLILLYQKIETGGRRKRGETIMIRCWNCRTELPEGVNFCSNCGKPLKRTIKERIVAHYIERTKP